MFKLLLNKWQHCATVRQNSKIQSTFQTIKVGSIDLNVGISNGL